MLEQTRNEIIQRQFEIIRLQKETIDELFAILCRYVDVTQEECAAAIAKINDAADIRKELGV